MINSSILALLLIMLFLVGVIMLIAHQGKPRLNKSHFTRHWQQIEQNSNLTEAVMRADSLLDEALRHAHIRGTTTGERLNNAKGIIRDINGTWFAHKLRNRIVHEVDRQPNSGECQRALRLFHKALKDLGAL